MNNQEVMQLILSIEGADMTVLQQSIDVKKKLLKKLKKQIKEIEYMKRTGGITLIVEENTVITTYHIDSVKRKSNKLKVIY